MDLLEARFRRRISQWELSRRSGVHQSRISLIENGHAAREHEKTRLVKGLNMKLHEIEWPSNGSGFQREVD